MGARDPRVDAYIAKANDFAKPILSLIREAVHKGCPEVTETMKWSSPFFMRKGILCNMAAFKEHCSLNFWRGEAAFGNVAEKKSGAMGQFGRISSVKDLPTQKVLVACVKEAARLDETRGNQKPNQRSKARAELGTPSDLDAALKKNEKAAETFKNFSPSHRREYIEWITEARREEQASSLEVPELLSFRRFELAASCFQVRGASKQENLIVGQKLLIGAWIHDCISVTFDCDNARAGAGA
jgi:hypothetical protein